MFSNIFYSIIGCLIQSVLPLPLRSETVYFVIHILSLGEADLNDVAGAPTISVGNECIVQSNKLYIVDP